MKIICMGCGESLEVPKCWFCGRLNDIKFVTQEQYKDLIKSPICKQVGISGKVAIFYEDTQLILKDKNNNEGGFD